MKVEKENKNSENQENKPAVKEKKENINYYLPTV
jgi:hypothetical protein